MKVSVIIPTYNRPKVVRRTLYSILRQNDPDYEVLLCNDDDSEFHGDTERVFKELQEEGMPIRHFYTGQYKRGAGWSVETYPYNVGIQEAQGEILILNSSDVMSLTNNIAQHREAQENPAMVFATVHGLAKDTQKNIDNYTWRVDPMSLLYEGSTEYMFCGKGRDYSGRGTDDSPRPYHYQMSVPKKALMDIRGFDEDFYGQMPGGDDDIAERLEKHGLKKRWSADILAAHQWHGQPDTFTMKGFASSNPEASTTLDFWENIRTHEGIVRNASHEWGQYPRDMKNLPSMSGVVGC